jgi:TRAP-type C4-dicarboxylate transport system substrate-binding protein
MTFRRIALLGLAAVVFGAAPAAAQETTLVFATTNAPNAHLNVRGHHPWAERINQAGKGVVRIDVRDGPTIANHLNYYQRVMDDVVQIAWGLPALIAGKFVLTNVTTLPFQVEKAEDASVALWRLHQSGLLDADFNDVVPLYLISFPQVGVHLSKAPRNLESLAGLKLAVGNKVGADILTRLGGAPISLPVTDYYEAIQRGTVDGSMSQWTQFQPFKLAEVTSYHIDTTLGSAAGMVFMSKKKWATLPEPVRKILMDNSGEKQSRVFGQFWDAVNEEGRASVRGRDKHTTVTLTAEQQNAWRQKVQPVVDDWVKATPGGDKVLDAFKSQIAKAQAGG